MYINIAGFNTFDYIIIFLVIASVLFALIRGFVGSCISFLWLIISSGGTYYISPLVKTFASSKIQNPLTSGIVSMFGAYVLSMIIASLINHQLYKITENIRGGAIDRSIGLTFGLLRGCIFACVVFFIILTTFTLLGAQKPEDKYSTLPEFVSSAQLYPLLKNGTNYFLSLLPRNKSDSADAVASLLRQFQPAKIAASLSSGDMTKIIGALPHDTIDPNMLNDLAKGTIPKNAQIKILQNILDKTATVPDAALTKENQAAIQMLKEYLDIATKDQLGGAQGK